MTRIDDVIQTVGPEARIAGETWPECSIRLTRQLHRTTTRTIPAVPEPFAQVYENETPGVASAPNQTPNVKVANHDNSKDR